MNDRVRARPARAAGWTIMEVLIAMGIVATGLLVLVQQLSISFRETTANEDRAFAYQKAAALLSEIDNAIEQGRITDAAELRAMHDDEHQVVLTTRLDGEGLPFDPAHPMSGNVRRQGHWLWSRRLRVMPHQDTDLQYCSVEVYHRTEQGGWHLEASLAQVFSLLPETNAPEQTLDVYVLAIGAAPSLWGNLGELRTHVETAAAQIGNLSQAGFRLHWITRLGYGRDPCYAPYVNTRQTADLAAPWSYWLPGALGGAHAGERLYDPALLGALHSTEAGLAGGWSATDAFPVTVADGNNHCMRSPAAWSLFEQRVDAGLEDEHEPPLQLLLDDLVQRPERYRNAIFVNLHGRALPCPPLRNYSDPARDPVGRPGVRVVTHPARLQTPRDPDGDGSHVDTEPLELRVHAYRTSAGDHVLGEPIHVRIYGGDFTGAINAGPDSTLFVHRLPGGIDPVDGSTNGTNRFYFGFDSSTGQAPTTPEQPFSMYYRAGFVAGAEPYTWLKLYNTPLVAPQFTVQGMHPDTRLYGLDYVPSPVAGTFARDLSFTSSTLAVRNTARWRIRIGRQAFVGGTLQNVDQTVRVVTSIGDDPTTGQRWPVPIQPLNRSETFAWWTRSPSAVPPTERAQFLGDPRLCPYADLMVGSGPLANGYNWHFDDLQSPSYDARPLWPCFVPARLCDGFGSGVRADAPRFLALFRDALQRAGAVLVSPTGVLADELLLGGEIVFAPAADTIAAVALHPDWTGGSTMVDTVTPGLDSGARLLQRGTWTAWPMLGELFPDDAWQSWYTTGNLPCGGLAQFSWRLRHTAIVAGLPLGADFTRPAGARLGSAGGTMLLACGSPTSTFGMPRAPAVGMPTPAINEINVATNSVPPGIAQAAATISLIQKPMPAIPAFAWVDTYPRSTANVLEVLWSSPGGPTCSVLGLTAAPDRSAFFVPWSIGASSPPAAEVAQQVLLAGMRAVHAAADPAQPGRIVQVPRLEILAPSPSQALQAAAPIELRWKTDWLRFDGHPYRSSLPTPFAENESALLYRVLVSADDGETWISALTDQPAVPGRWPEDAAERLADSGTGIESFTLTPAEPLPEGRYTFLIEAWHADRRCHSSSHRVVLHVRQ